MLTVIHGLMLSCAIVWGIRGTRPVLVVLTTTLLGMNVIGASTADASGFLNAAPEALLHARVYCILSDALLIGFASLARRYIERGAVGGGVHERINPDLAERLLTSAFYTTLLGVGCLILNTIMLGGVEEQWSRKWAQAQSRVPADSTRLAGLVSFFTNEATLFPYVVFYLTLRGAPVLLRHQVRALVLLTIAVGMFALSGTTTYPLMMLLPFGITFILRGRSISVSRLGILAMVGLGGITVLRFARYVGSTTGGNLAAFDVVTIWQSFLDSDLTVEQSFNMFQAFTLVSENVDLGYARLGGASYLLPLLYYCPGFLLNGKADLIMDSRPDAYTMEHFAPTTCHAFLPSGYYGEAYLNFGLPGLIVVSAIFGLIVGVLDTRALRTLFGLPGKLIVPLCTIALINATRMYVGEMITFITTQLGIWFVVHQTLTWAATQWSGRRLPAPSWPGL